MEMSDSMNIGFRHHKVHEIEYLTVPAFEETGLVTHCFTTRLGGVSTGEYRSLNLGLWKNDHRENVIQNYKLISGILNINYTKFVFSRQVHGDNIGVVTAQDAGKGFLNGGLNGFDGFITNQPGIPLATFHADCVPLFFLDPVKKAVALAHSGWRGTVKKIAQKTIHKMVTEYDCNIKNLLVAIGPSIGKCHFEVDKPVVDQFLLAYGSAAERFTEKRHNGKYHIDLWEANIMQLQEFGIEENNITLANECTVCNKQKYFSHRGDAGETGSLAAIIELKKK